MSSSKQTNTKSQAAKKPIIPIFFACDDNYCPMLGVALHSLVSNASKRFEYRIIVLYKEISQNYMSELSFLMKPGFTLEFANVNEHLKEFNSLLFTRDYYTNTTYYRFFIPIMFPEFEKAIYLDSDIVVKGDISKFYRYQLGNNLVGAIRDEVLELTPAFSRYSPCVLGIPTREYFNAGILLINLKKFREEDIYHQFIKLLKTVKYPVAQDQDYLNVMCKGKVKWLPVAWNKTPVYLKNFNKRDVKIVHFKINWKPWHIKGVMFEDIFWKYASETQFNETLLKMREDYSPEMISRDNEAYVKLSALVEKEIKKAAKSKKAKVVIQENKPQKIQLEKIGEDSSADCQDREYRYAV